MNDWRRQGQERTLKSRHLQHRVYTPYRPGWDHDHCEFCGAKFSQIEGDLHQGYTTDDQYSWICEVCFEDFQIEFEWSID